MTIPVTNIITQSREIVVRIHIIYHRLPYPKTNENKISTKGKIEPQHIQTSLENLNVDIAD